MTTATVRAAAAPPLKGFKVYAVDGPCAGPSAFVRRDCYKVMLLTVRGRLHYAHQHWELDGTYLFCFSPHRPYSLDLRGGSRQGYICVFTEAFIASLDRSEMLLQSPLFNLGSVPLFALSEAQVPFLTSIFQKMQAEQQADYPFRGELLRTYLHLVLHEALRAQPLPAALPPPNAAARLTSRFLSLLEQQFPVDNPAQPPPLLTAQAFADHLAVHVNHLNKAVKQVTGKPTSVHLITRLADEAKALLQHTQWSVADIAYCLGFAYPTYFNNFFKKQTGTTPLAWRKLAGMPRLAAS